MKLLRRDQTEALIAHAAKEAPNECCGLLAGRHGLVERIYGTTNADHSPSTYIMDRQQQLAAMRDIEAAGLDLMAIYHSHPRTPAYPSKTDVRCAYYPEVLYIIVSLAGPEVRGYRLADGKIIEVRVSVDENSHGSSAIACDIRL